MNKCTRALTCATLLAATLLANGCSKQQVPTSAATVLVANVSDIDVTDHVRAALRQSEVLKRFDINVVTLKGDVRLIGVLDSQAQIDEAIKLVRASDGTHSIHDELTIRK
jgi:hyperosmotically inducible protein